MTASPKRSHATRVLVTALALVLVLAACGSSAKTTKTTGGNTTATSAGTDYSKLPAATLNGSGSTFQKAFEEAAIAALQDEASQLEINYTGGGSGKGKTDLQTKTVDFAGTDSLPKPADLASYQGGALLYFPIVAAPITVSYNLRGVDKLRLGADTVAKIFSRQVKKWDDAAIKADNPSASLPSNDIVVAHRADGSGTTSNFTKYLAAAAPTAWTLGSGDTVPWPSDTQAGNGNPGVAQIVKQTDGAIGYVDYSDAKASGLSFASIRNAAGTYVEPTVDGTLKAVEAATINADLSYNPLNAPGADAYPIATPTWIMVYKHQTDRAKGLVIRGYLEYILTKGQDLAEATDFAKLPESLRQKAIDQLGQIVIPA